MQTRWASGSGRPGDDRTFAAARVLGFEAGAEPMSRANAEKEPRDVAAPALHLVTTQSSISNNVQKSFPRIAPRCFPTVIRIAAGV